MSTRRLENFLGQPEICSTVPQRPETKQNGEIISEVVVEEVSAVTESYNEVTLFL